MPQFHFAAYYADEVRLRNEGKAMFEWKVNRRPNR
jgi:hypothetical protein